MCLFPVWDDVTVTEISDRDVVGTTGWRQSWRQLGGAWWRQELPQLVVQQQDGEARAQGSRFNVKTQILE